MSTTDTVTRTNAVASGASPRFTPLLLVGQMWPGLVDWVRESMLSFETPLISPEDVAIPICVANADEAVAFIKRHKEAQVIS